MEGKEADMKSKESVKCEVCNEGEAKYRCPRCLLKTCSLPCVKKHKEVEDCTGVREKTKFTKVSQYKDLHLLSDYRFLEDVHRKADSASRDQIKHVSRDLPRHLKGLVNGAKKNGTTLRLLPKAFTKRMRNKSKFLYATKQMLWMIEWVFPQADAKHLDRHLQGSTISEALLKLYDPEKTDSIVRHTLKHYVPKGVDGVCFFLRQEGCPANDIRYYALKPSLTIEQCLKGKTVIEYPTIIVVFKEKADGYPLVEEEEESSSGESESTSGSESDSTNRTENKETVDAVLKRNAPSSGDIVPNKKSKTDENSPSVDNTDSTENNTGASEVTAHEANNTVCESVKEEERQTSTGDNSGLQT